MKNIHYVEEVYDGYLATKLTAQNIERLNIGQYCYEINTAICGSEYQSIVLGLLPGRGCSDPYSKVKYYPALVWKQLTIEFRNSPTKHSAWIYLPRGRSAALGVWLAEVLAALFTRE